MPPMKEPHADGTDRIDESLKENLSRRARVRVQGPVRINEYSLLEPDIAVLRRRDDYHLEHPSPADVFLLIEVADSSLELDREVKLARYAAAGILEVWIVNLRARQVEGFSDPVDGDLPKPAGGHSRREDQPAGVSGRFVGRGRFPACVRSSHDYYDHHRSPSTPVTPQWQGAAAGAPAFHCGRGSCDGPRPASSILKSASSCWTERSL